MGHYLLDLIDLVKSAKIAARELRGARRGRPTPQRHPNEAQQRYWPFYEVVDISMLFEVTKQK